MRGNGYEAKKKEMPMSEKDQLKNEIGSLLGTLSSLFEQKEPVSREALAEALRRTADELASEAKIKANAPEIPWQERLKGACGKEEKAAFVSLVKKGFDVNKAFPAPGGKWQTPLSLACSLSSKNPNAFQWVKFFLSLGALPNAPQIQKTEPPLLSAMEALASSDECVNLIRRLTVINLLMDSGAKWDPIWGGGIHYFCSAVIENDHEWGRLSSSGLAAAQKIGEELLGSEICVDDAWHILCLDTDAGASVAKLKSGLLLSLSSRLNKKSSSDFLLKISEGSLNGIDLKVDQNVSSFVALLLKNGANPNASCSDKGKKPLCLINERLPLTMPNGEKRAEMEKWIELLLDAGAAPESILPTTNPLEIASTAKVKALIERKMLGDSAQNQEEGKRQKRI